MDEFSAKSDVEGLPKIVVDTKKDTGSPWQVWGTVLTIAAVGLVLYGRFNRANERVDEQRRENQRQAQERQEQGIREVQQMLQRDAEQGGNSGPALRKLFGQPERPTPRATK